jgi:UDP-glucose 4-epimerase
LHHVLEYAALTSKPAGLVIGGAGYIGSPMVLDLERAGYPVITLNNLSRGHRELVPAASFRSMV